MEFGVFLNGYIPGPAAHISELEHEELIREAEYVIFADKHNWKYAWLGEHHALTEYSHMSAPGSGDGVHRRPDRLHPPRLRDHQPLAPQGAPGALRRARRDARPLHAEPLRVRHRPRRRRSRGRELQHPRQELHQGRVGRSGQGDPADVGAGRLLVPRRALHRSVRAQHPAQAVRQGSPADLGRVRQPAHVHPRRRARHRRHRVQLRADLRAPRPHRGLQGRRRRTAPTRSGSSRTTT